MALYTKSLSETVKSNIIAFRKRQDLTQQELAQKALKAGAPAIFTRYYIGRLEGGVTNITTDALQWIAAALDIPVVKLLLPLSAKISLRDLTVVVDYINNKAPFSRKADLEEIAADIMCSLLCGRETKPSFQREQL